MNEENAGEAVDKETCTAKQPGHIVDFADNDVADPLNWSPARKILILSLIISLLLTTNFATIITAPVSPQILSDLHSDNQLYRTLLISIWEIGEIVGPLFWGPLSELYGRLPVMHATNAAFVCFLVGGALSKNIQMVIAFRFLGGTMVASTALSPAIVGDLYRKEERGSAMSTMMLGLILSPVVGPIIGSYLGQDQGWRWTFWLPAILAGATSLPLLIFYRETYRVRILALETRRRRVCRDGAALRSKYDTGEPATAVFSKAIIRPLRLLCTSPMLMIISLHMSITQGLTYLMLTVISPVFQDVYSFSEGESGLAYLGISIGFAIGAISCRIILDRLSQRATEPNPPGSNTTPHDALTPEKRLPPVLITCIVMPIGFFMFGWTVHAKVHWMVPLVATGLVGIGQVATSIATRSYIVDAFGIHGASAVSAMLVPMNTASALLPLAGPPLYARLGLGWGNSVLGFLAVACLPVPMVLLVFGRRIREASGMVVVE